VEIGGRIAEFVLLGIDDILFLAHTKKDTKENKKG